MDEPRLGETRTLITSDGARLAAVHVSGPSDLCFVMAHGFTGRWRYERVRRLIRLMSEYGGVVAFDFRGHGDSTGKTSLGIDEPLDVEAAVRWARLLGYQNVATLGFSMGGAVSVRHQTEYGTSDCVVSVSAPAFWFYRGTLPTRRVQRMVSTGYGRLMARSWWLTRIGVDPWLNAMPPDPATAAAGIPPTPYLVVHGDQDSYFPLEHPYALYESALAAFEAHGGAGTKPELWIEPGFGHAENSVTDDLAVRIAQWVRGALPAPTSPELKP
jgi:pimeloyl-ACP methyl ester carboxylesterase